MATTSCSDYYESIIRMPVWERLTTTAAAILGGKMTECWEGGQITTDQYETAMAILREHNDAPEPAETGPADFIFRVESVRLTSAQKSKIATAIQGAVLTGLAQLDLGTRQNAPDYLFRPISWCGGRIVGLAEIESASGTTLVAAEEKQTQPA